MQCDLNNTKRVDPSYSITEYINKHKSRLPFFTDSLKSCSFSSLPFSLTHTDKMAPGHSPCASCKLLRRRCAKDCIFAPYFPSDNPHKFAFVHKVFGASNVGKMLQVLYLHYLLNT